MQQQQQQHTETDGWNLTETNFHGPSLFEPLKFYCIYILNEILVLNANTVDLQWLKHLWDHEN